MTIEQFVQYVSRKRGCTRAVTRTWVYLMIEEMYAALAEGNPLNFPPLGQLHIVMMKGHFGRNPFTGERVVVNPQRTVKFKPSTELKQQLASLQEEDVGYLNVKYLPEGRTNKKKKQKEKETEDSVNG